MKKGTKKVAAGAAIAGAVGYMAGILTAPKSGKETRRDIKNAALKTRTEGERQLKALHSELNELISKGKRRSSRLKDAAKTEFAGVLARAQTAKEKARAVLSNIHEGEAGNAELNAAIKDVNSAITNLRKYVDKQTKTTASPTRASASRSAAARTATRRSTAAKQTPTNRRRSSKKS